MKTASRRPTSRGTSEVALTALLLLISVITVRPCRAQSEAQGIVIGSVLNAATGDFLAGVVVTVEGTGLSEVTDRTGRFEISRVPTGRQVLRATYPGLDASSTPVEVARGQTSVPPISLTSEVYKLQEFVVAGLREGNAHAIAVQRQAANLKTVVAIDAFGNLADSNLGEFLKRLPGISTGGSIDEVTTVRVRGAAAAHTAVTLDGTRLPSPGGQKTEREFEVDKLPADFIESIEVVKAPTPDMDADAIGGTVNLISRSAFDTKEAYVSYRAGINHQTLFSNTGPFGSLQYSDAFGPERKFGVFLSLNYSKSFRDRDSSSTFYAGPAEGPNPIWRVRFQPDKRSRERTGGGAKFDYRFNDKSSVFLSVMFNDYLQDNRSRELTVEVREDRAVPGRDVRDLSTREPSNNLRTVFALGREATQSNTTLDTQRTWSFQAGGKQQWVDCGYKLDYGATYAPANGHQDRWLFNLQSGRTLGWIIERQDDLDYFPTLTRTSGEGLLGDWNVSSITKSPFFRYGDSEEAVWAGHVNLAKNLPTRLPVTLKAGLRHRGQQLERKYFEDGRRNRVYVAPDWNLFKTTAVVQERPFFGIERYANLAIFADAQEIFEYTQQNPQGWQQTFSPREIQESFLDNGSVREEVSAAYLQANVRLGRLQLLGGLRMEETQVKGAGWVYDRNEAGPPAAATVDQLIAFYRSEWHLIENRRTYRNWFPGLHLRYEFAGNLLARASYSETIGRPAFQRLIPKTAINDTVSEDGDPAQSIRMNNVGLLPQESRNYDVSLEYYFEPVGMISVGAFQKDIKNFIYSIDTNLTPALLQQFRLDPKYEGWTFRSEGNRGGGEIRGIELAYSQHLGGFASWLRGFSMYANYTHVTSNGDLTDIIPDVWNIGLAYERRPWTLRFHLNYNGDYQTDFSDNPMDNRFNQSQLNGEVSVSYRFTHWLSVFADVTNVFGNDLREDIGGPRAGGRLLAGQIQDIGRRAIVGVRGRF
ncbi:MAG: TonB-dependent receptor [Opitutaceae bacterium]|nr:TonB-dependent receptor [Opitutaceae bacterium]